VTIAFAIWEGFEIDTGNSGTRASPGIPNRDCWHIRLALISAMLPKGETG